MNALLNADSLNINLFPGIAVEDGSFALSLGIGLASPVEVALDATGSLENGLSLSSSVTGRFDFRSRGYVEANLPIVAMIDGSEWRLDIMLQDEDLFALPGVAVKVDFNACQILEPLQILLGKLGSLDVKAESILGPNVPISGGIDFGLNSLDDFFPDVGSFVGGVLEAKSEFFHLCKENEATGASPPSIEDVIKMISEDILGGVDDGFSTTSPGAPRRRALRAHHLPYTRFTRPGALGRRRLEEGSSELDDLIDSLDVGGGYDGEAIFVQVDLDLSKQVMDGLSNIIQKPLSLLNDNGMLNDVFASSGSNQSTVDLPFGSLDFDADFSAGAHLSVRVGLDVAGDEFLDLLSMNSTQIFSRAFIEFVDISAKFSASATVSAALEIAGVEALSVVDGTIAFALGLGIEESSEKIYFNEIDSVSIALRRVKWQKVGGMDISLPVGGKLLGELDLEPILSISDGNLFDSVNPTVSLDFDIL